MIKDKFFIFWGVIELCVKGYTHASFLTDKVVFDRNLVTSLVWTKVMLVGKVSTEL